MERLCLFVSLFDVSFRARPACVCVCVFVFRYPILPWVFSDYTREGALDLSDPTLYRDFARPVGAQHKAHAERARQRFRSMAEAAADSELPAFHHGSHYSNQGV